MYTKAPMCKKKSRPTFGAVFFVYSVSLHFLRPRFTAYGNNVLNLHNSALNLVPFLQSLMLCTAAALQKPLNFGYLASSAGLLSTYQMVFFSLSCFSNIRRYNCSPLRTK